MVDGLMGGGVNFQPGAHGVASKLFVGTCLIRFREPGLQRRSQAEYDKKPPILNRGFFCFQGMNWFPCPC